MKSYLRIAKKFSLEPTYYKQNKDLIFLWLFFEVVWPNFNQKLETEFPELKETKNEE